MAYIDFDPHCSKFSPLKKLHLNTARDTLGSTTLDNWRAGNDSLLKNGTQQRQNTDRLVDDGYRLVQDRNEANKLSERNVKQNIEHRVDAIGACEDDLEGALYDTKIEDDKLQYCHDRLRDSVKSNVQPIWELAKKCLELRAQRPPQEAVEDDVNYLLREEMKQAERTAKIYDDIVSRIEDQHRRNNAITYRCKHLKNMDYETQQAVKIVRDLAQRDGEHQKKDLLTTLTPMKMNFAEWSALVEDVTRQALKENSASHKLRLEGNDAIRHSNETIQRLYRDIDDALKRRITALKLAKDKQSDEHKKIHERIQEINKMKDHLTNLHNTTIKPEREAQHALAKTALKSHLKKAADPVHNALHAEIHEFKDSISQAAGELDKCQKQLITLRSVDSRLLDDIHRKEKSLHIDEVQVSELRNLAKLRRV